MRLRRREITQDRRVGDDARREIQVGFEAVVDAGAHSPEVEGSREAPDHDADEEPGATLALTSASLRPTCGERRTRPCCRSAAQW